MAIFPGVPGLAGCPLNSPSPSIPKLCVSVRVVNEKEWERRGPKALESRCRGGGVSPSQVGDGSGEGLCSPQKIFDFFSDNGAFWCILCACVTCKTVSKSSFVCQLPIGQLSHMADVSCMIYHTHKHIYQSQQSAGQTHMPLILWIVDIHVHATVYLYILLSCILFQEIQLHFTKDTFCWWHVYFYEHISGVCS